MAFALTHIGLVEAWTAASEYADDGVLDVDNTICMKNGDTGSSCDEFKEGVLNCRVEIHIPPAAVSALTVRFYCSEAMTTGDQELLPYIDANSVSPTNAVSQFYGTGWIEHAVDASFLAELADLGDKFAVRLASPNSAKSKLSEVEIDITYTPDYLTGITKDKNGAVLVSCKVSIFKVISEGPPETYLFLESKISDGATGAYSFNVWAGNKYMVYAEKDDSPHVFDASDNVLEADP